MLVLTVDIGDAAGRSGRIEIRDGDSARELAWTFCERYGLDMGEVLDPLNDYIQENIDDVYTRIGDRFGEEEGLTANDNQWISEAHGSPAFAACDAEFMEWNSSFPGQRQASLSGKVPIGGSERASPMSTEGRLHSGRCDFRKLLISSLTPLRDWRFSMCAYVATVCKRMQLSGLGCRGTSFFSNGPLNRKGNSPQK